MAVNKDFLGHGIFLEFSPIGSLRRYANYKSPPPAAAPTPKQLVANFIRALTDMHMSAVWIQLFSRSGELDPDGKGATKELVDGLKAANIGQVGWGYCHGKKSVRDLGLAKDLCAKYGISAFVADVEPGNKINGVSDDWKPNDFTTLIDGLQSHFGKDNLGISSFSRLDLHDDAAKILKLARDKVCLYAPQIYWNSHKPVDFAEASIKSFKDAGIATPLVGTTQSYWELDEGTPSQATMEDKLADFIDHFPDADWSKLIGLNWYHAGNQNTAQTGGMSDAMIKKISDARIDQKPFATP